jgi:CheY-like chemotaxis protein
MGQLSTAAREGVSMDTKKTIMVVDDNPDIITIVKTILEGRGYTVFSASSGPELLNMLPNHKADLIILDIMMPEMDGLEVLTRLKGKTETASIPVILLTAKVQYEDVLGGYKLGADYYITKPFTSTQLVNGINLLLGEGKPQQ